MCFCVKRKKNKTNSPCFPTILPGFGSIWRCGFSLFVCSFYIVHQLPQDFKFFFLYFLFSCRTRTCQGFPLVYRSQSPSTSLNSDRSLVAETITSMPNPTPIPTPTPRTTIVAIKAFHRPTQPTIPTPLANLQHHHL